MPASFPYPGIKIKHVLMIGVEDTLNDMKYFQFQRNAAYIAKSGAGPLPEHMKLNAVEERALVYLGRECVIGTYKCTLIQIKSPNMLHPEKQVIL